ncbi:3-deoxy-D-manno-octulosonic acid transferase [Pigmentiphaga soli]|uniref:3-deoxy-D-manno-octulosonic acid transferase n=1 Tax=Pigmentiphaga soli TaxID=1007095 RepID=UPI0031EA5CE0
MWRGLYSALWRLAAPWLWLRIWRRARREPAYGAFPFERFGRYRREATVPSYDGYRAAPVWVHAVSLGETRAAQPLIQALLDRGLTVLLTHMTATGRTEGARLFEQAIAQGRLRQAWLPYDLPGAVRRFFRHFTPRCGLLIETEVWPNLIFAAHWHAVPMALVSARLSASSARKALYLKSLARAAYGGLDLVLAQTAADAARLAEVGARAPQVVGNLKFDLGLPPEQLRAGRDWRAALGRPVVVLASTREGEEEMLLAAIARRPPAGPGPVPLVILVPRHPQRFDDVAALLKASGLRTVRRSTLAGWSAAELPSDTQVLLGDSLGEMPFYYSTADVSVVGGSFAPLGGQNLIEAAACGSPVIVGPHTFNFAQASEDAIAAGAARRAADAAHAWQLALELLADDGRREAMRAAAAAFTATHTGATRRVMLAIGNWIK